MVYEPRPSKGIGDPRNPYQGRWRVWYPAIADWMIRNPGGSAEACAKELGKSPNTIRFIMATDLFRDYFARRREDWQRNHDFAIVTKTTHVAEKALDLMLEKMEKQADKIPMNLVTDVATSALDRLGYAPKPPASQSVNVNVDTGNKIVMIPISAGALEEARDAIREAEKSRRLAALELEAEPVEPKGEVGGSAGDPAVPDPGDGS